MSPVTMEPPRKLSERLARRGLHTTAEEVAALETRIEALEKDYHELIYAVASKYEGETRHQTALRYIIEREIRGMGDGQSALAAEVPNG